METPIEYPNYFLRPFAKTGVEQSIQSVLFDIDDRLNELEHKKSTKKETNRAQQMLFLHHIGALKLILGLVPTTQNGAKLLSAMLNFSSDNLKKDLTTINQNNCRIKTSKNYKVLVKTFRELGLMDLEEICKEEYDKALAREKNYKKK